MPDDLSPDRGIVRAGTESAKSLEKKTTEKSQTLKENFTFLQSIWIGISMEKQFTRNFLSPFEWSWTGHLSIKLRIINMK